MTAPAIQGFGGDRTTRWSAREGDWAIWCRWQPALLPSTLTVVDFWYMRDGDFLALTNRAADLPPWFPLHPTECTTGSLRTWMKNRGIASLDDIADDDPAEAPNLWRLMAGDRLGLLSLDRSGTPDWSRTSLWDLRVCALAVKESNRVDAGIEEAWGAQPDLVPDQVTAGIKQVIAFVKALKPPRILATEWIFGA